MVEKVPETESPKVRHRQEARDCDQNDEERILTMEVPCRCGAVSEQRVQHRLFLADLRTR